MKETLAKCNEDGHLPVLHISRVELRRVARKIEECDSVTQMLFANTLFMLILAISGKTIRLGKFS